MREVRERAAAFGLDVGQAEVIAWIIGPHSSGNLEELPEKPVPLGTAEVDVRRLAALFKLADLLHTDYRRVSQQVVEFGGKLAEENPKTRFRLCMRGWRFDDRGRLELYAVLKDWGDLMVVPTGFEKTRQELEPVVCILRDAGLPWELALRADQTDLEREAKSSAEAERRVERAFLGMNFYSHEDAAVFKGRDEDIHTLHQRVLGQPVTLLVGDSGVGKTSILLAGLFPRLQLLGWRTTYTRPFDDPDRFVVRDLWRTLLENDPPASMSILETLERVCREDSTSYVLIALDQFEDVAHVPLPTMFVGLRRALVAVQARRFRHLRLLLSYRADAEAALGPLFQDASCSERGFPRTYLQSLSRDGARAALEAGFEQALVGVDDLLLDAIADDLERQTPTSGVYPPYVQMVGERLCELAREGGEGVVTQALYERQGGCAGIIGRYLLDRLSEFGDCREAAERTLTNFVCWMGSKRQVPLAELQRESGLGAEFFSQLLAQMVDKRLVRPLGHDQYELVHDHLAWLVSQEIVDPNERRTKQLRELLGLKASAYIASSIPLHPIDMAELYTVRERISPDENELRLLLHSSLVGRGPAYYWLRQIPLDGLLTLLQDGLHRPLPQLRWQALRLMIRLRGTTAIPYLRHMLQDHDARVRRRVVAQLAKLAGQEAIPDLRRMLQDPDPMVRLRAVRALATVGMQEAIPDLRRMLGDEDYRVQGEAIEKLASLAGRDAIPDLLKLMRPHERVMLEVVDTLVPLLGENEITIMLAMLQDEDEDIRLRAAEGLARLSSHEAIPALRELMHARSWSTRCQAVQVLASMIGREAIPDLRKLLRADSSDAQITAAQILVRIAGRDAIPDLQAVVNDTSTYEDAWIEVLQILAQLGGQRHIPDLRKMLKDSRWPIRERAIRGLAAIMGQQAIPHLRHLLEDESPDVRATTVRTLASLGAQQVIPDLLKMLNDSTWQVQIEALEALACLGEREAIPRLQEALRDEEGVVREQAEGMLENLVTEDDLDWLSEWVIRYPLSGTGEAARRILVHLERRLYCSFG